MADTVKHTPRPWKADARYDNYAVRLVGADGRFIASSSWSDNSENSKIYPSKAETFENFGLIATAVNCFEDLLLSLQGLLEAYSKPDEPLCCDGRDCGCMGSTVHQQAEHYARAAIAKATGGQ